MIHSENNIDACIHLAGDGPPSSALIDEFKRRYIMMPMAISASPQKSATAKPMLRRRRRRCWKKISILSGLRGLTCPAQHWRWIRLTCDKSRPGSTPGQCQGIRWPRCCPSRFRCSCLPSHPAWMQWCWQMYLQVKQNAAQAWCCCTALIDDYLVCWCQGLQSRWP